MKRIGKKEARIALTKYNIEFGFPCIATTGIEITCWTDCYTHNGDTQKLREAIKADKDCPFIVSNIPSNMMYTIRLERA